MGTVRDPFSPNGPSPNPEGAQALLYARDLGTLYEQEKNRRQELQLALERQEAVFQAMNDGVAVLSADLRVLQANRAFCRILDCQLGSVEGKTLAQLLPDKSTLTSIQQWRDAATEPVIRLEASSHLDGQVRTLLVTVSRMRDNCLVLVLHDQTAEQHAQLLKDEFLAILSHELRTPLTGILGFASLLQDEFSYNNELRFMAQAIENSGNRMLARVNELLQIADLTRDNVQNLSQPVCMDQLLELALLELEPEIREKNLHLDIRVSELQGLVIPGNQSLFKDALQHLLRNAVQFNRPNGTVRLRARRRGPELTIAVADNGQGIARHKQDMVFQSFYQAQAFATRSKPGLGLGLTLAKRIVQLHGGTIILKSKKDKTTCVVVTLPLTGTVEAIRRQFIPNREEVEA